MDDVQFRIHSGRALLDSASAWASGSIRDTTKMAEGTGTGQPRFVGPSMEKSSEDRSLGSVPFDYGKLGDSGRAPDVRSDEPEVNLIGPEFTTGPWPEGTVENSKRELTKIADTQPVFDEIKNQETREQMNTANPTVSLIKHNQVKALALSLMAERFSFNGQPKFTRVSDTFCEQIERFVYTAIKNAIQKHPSTGKVIKDF
jgi:hypothetical protein